VDWIVGLVVAVGLIALLYGLQARRRRQAGQAAQRIGGAVVTGPVPGYAAPPPGGIGAPNPAVPPPAVAPDQRTGIALSGPPVQLQICGLPALAWQRAEHGQYSYQGTRLALIVDAGVGLPILQIFHRAGFLQPFADAHGPSGLPALDERYRLSGDLDAWRPVLASRAVQQAVLAYPLETFSVLGGRMTFVSTDGVHLEPAAVSAIAQLAATIIGAVPPQITGASAAPPPTATVGTDLTNVDSIVSNVLAKSDLSPEQQQAMLALIRANHPPA
jgi:hypothetical protein